MILSCEHKLSTSIPIIIGLKVFGTKTSTANFKSTVIDKTRSLGIGTPAITFFWNSILRPIYLKFGGVVSPHMRGLICKAEIFDSIVGFVSVYVVNILVFIKRSLKELFHNMSVLKNPFSVNIYPYVSFFGNRGLSFFKIIPCGLVFVKSVSPHSSVVGFAYFSPLNLVLTAFDFANVTLHSNYVNRGEIECQY